MPRAAWPVCFCWAATAGPRVTARSVAGTSGRDLDDNTGDDDDDAAAAAAVDPAVGKEEEEEEEEEEKAEDEEEEEEEGGEPVVAEGACKRKGKGRHSGRRRE